MIKIFIDPSLNGNFITRIGTKLDIVKLWVKTLQIFYTYKGTLSNNERSSNDEVGIYIQNGRVYYESQDTIFSVYFPFSIIKKENNLDYFSHRYCTNITNAVISFIISIIDAQHFDFHNFNKLHDVITSPDEDFDLPVSNFYIWEFISHLFLINDGYIRYDYDLERQDGYRHPLHHFDIFYQNNVTFKIGLNNGMNFDTFQDILDKDSDCHFLQKPLNKVV